MFVWWRPKWEADVNRMDGLRALECTIFRNETRVLSSDLIRAAIAALGHPEARTALRDETWPADGLITGVGSEATKRRRSKRSLPGRCFREAGFVPFDHAPGAADVWLRYAGPRPTEVPDPQLQLLEDVR